MTVQKAANIGPAHIEIACESFGAPDAPPVLLIMGLGSQMLVWPDGFIEELVAHNLRPIRFDNRDVGLSTHFSAAPMPDFQAAMAGDTSSAAYNLSDMAADTVGLLDALGIASAHLVGASMGGFIAQTVAIEYPDRVRSLTSMMSTTGAPGVGQPAPETARLFAGGTPRTREEVMDRAVLGAEIIGSPGYPFDEKEIRERTGLAYDRAYDPAGMVRQSVACLASGDRTARLRALNVPALVIHGANDRMAAVSGGLATANAIPGAQLVIFEGMGHSLPRELWPKFASLIAELVHHTEARCIQDNPMKYAAFIRNINVGQKKFPNRPQLEQAFLTSGAHSAVSFQSNGTVIVDLNSNTNLASFTESVKAYLLSVANFSEAIFLRDLEAIRATVAQDPFATIDFTGYDGKCVAYYDYAGPVDGIFPLESVKQDCLVFTGTSHAAYSITRRIKGVSGYPTPLLEQRLQTPVTTRSWTTILRLTTRF